MTQQTKSPAEQRDVREALAELYEFCRGLNDFRVDSKLARKVQTALRSPPSALEAKGPADAVQRRCPFCGFPSARYAASTATECAKFWCDGCGLNTSVPAVTGGEPVAWRTPLASGEYQITSQIDIAEMWSEGGAVVEPLYARLPKAAGDECVLTVCTCRPGECSFPAGDSAASASSGDVRAAVIEAANIPQFMKAVRARWNLEYYEFDAIEKVLSDPECFAALSQAPATDGVAVTRPNCGGAA